MHCLVRIGSGGVEQRRLLLAQKLDRDRFEQQIVCTQAIGGLPTRFVDARCPIHEVGVLRSILDPDPYRRAIRAVREYRPDIIHGAVYEGVALAAIAGRIAGVPAIVGEETSDPVNRRWRGHVLYRLLTAMTHQMIAVSPAVDDYLVDKIRLPRSKVTLIMNGVPTPRPVDGSTIERLRADLKIRDKEFVIGTVGRLEDSHKRFSDLIRALSILCDRGVPARLVIVGAGSDETWLRDLAVTLNVGEHVTFAGYQADVGPFYRVFDSFALASAHEAFGLVNVEAMQAGLPVVATRVGGVPSIVLDGETGFLVDPFRPDQLADRLHSLYLDSDLRRRFGNAGRDRAASTFNADDYVARVERFYLDLLRKRGIE